MNDFLNNFEVQQQRCCQCGEYRGGMISGATQTTAFNGFNKIQSITDSGNGYNLDFTYGPDQERWKTVLKQNGNVIKTSILAGDYEQITENGATRRFYYLDGGAIYVKQEGKSDKVYYTCTDHLGSIVKLVEADGTEVFPDPYLQMPDFSQLLAQPK